jgi:hypothetical protein
LNASGLRLSKNLEDVIVASRDRFQLFQGTWTRTVNEAWAGECWVGREKASVGEERGDPRTRALSAGKPRLRQPRPRTLCKSATLCPEPRPVLPLPPLPSESATALQIPDRSPTNPT